MQDAGMYLQWKSYPVTTGSGYNLTLFNLTANELGEAFEALNGPLLLTHGVFSDSVDWLTRNDLES